MLKTLDDIPEKDRKEFQTLFLKLNNKNVTKKDIDVDTLNWSFVDCIIKNIKVLQQRTNGHALIAYENALHLTNIYEKEYRNSISTSGTNYDVVTEKDKSDRDKIIDLLTDKFNNPMDFRFNVYNTINTKLLFSTYNTFKHHLGDIIENLEENKTARINIKSSKVCYHSKLTKVDSMNDFIEYEPPKVYEYLYEVSFDDIINSADNKRMYSFYKNFKKVIACFPELVNEHIVEGTAEWDYFKKYTKDDCYDMKGFITVSLRKKGDNRNNKQNFYYNKETKKYMRPNRIEACTKKTLAEFLKIKVSAINTHIRQFHLKELTKNILASKNIGAFCQYVMSGKLTRKTRVCDHPKSKVIEDSIFTTLQSLGKNIYRHIILNEMYKDIIMRYKSVVYIPKCIISYIKDNIKSTRKGIFKCDPGIVISLIKRYIDENRSKSKLLQLLAA